MGRKKNSELLELSDDAVGVATISTYRQDSVCIYFDQATTEEMDCEAVIFSKSTLTVRPATLDERGHRLSARTKAGCAIYVSKMPNSEEILGQYEVVKEGMNYKLYPLNAST